MKASESDAEKIFNILFAFFVAFVFLVIGIPVLTYQHFAHDLQEKATIVNRRDTGLTLQDDTGKTFFRFYNAQSKKDIRITSIPQVMQDAVVASEDKRFYEHDGYSILGILRAFIANLKSDTIEQGGSTITQQLAKNAFLTPKKSYIRKYQEVVLAEEIEKRYSKQQILEMYLNSAYFGEGAFGIEKAAEIYFDKTASELTLSEAALLAGILPAPSALSPISGDRSSAFLRQENVLQDLKAQGYINNEQYLQAKAQTIVFRTMNSDVNAVAPHFALYVRDQLIDTYGEQYVANSGMVVKTSLDRTLQKYAQAEAKNQVAALASQNVTNAAVVVIDVKTHGVKAMAGSIDWSNDEFGKVNVAIRQRQPGSSFKPYVYAKALEDREITLATTLHDQPTTFDRNYSPQNYDRRFRGNVTVRRALANSLNVPAVELMMVVGIDDALSSARRFGLSTLKGSSNYGPSLVLGTGGVTLLEHTNGYATFADNGQYAPPYVIDEIYDKYGNLVYRHDSAKVAVIEPGVAYLITSVLSDTEARKEVFGGALDTSVPAAVKTGTTDDYKDSWTMGYTPDVAVGVWVGNNDNAPMAQIAGSLGAAPIWRSIIEYTSEGVVHDFPIPGSVEMVRICPNGLLVPSRAPAGFGRSEFFINGTQPTSY